MKDKNYVLAMYDVRGKQNFIYSSRKCKEIVGASHLIADVFSDYLYPAAKEYRNALGKAVDKNREAIYTYSHQNNGAEAFSAKKFVEHMESGEFLGEVVYEGGGNFLVLYKDAKTCEEINKRFTFKLLENIGTLKVLCTYVEISDFENFESDRKRLYVKHRINEAQESVIYPVNTLPFVQTSPESGRPYTGMFYKVKKNNVAEKVTTEELAKYKKYEEYLDKLKKLNKDEYYDKEGFLLDDLVTERGNESLLAVIYIDGNSMGAKVQACLNGLKTYDECVTKLREFSENIHQQYVEERTKAINEILEAKYKGEKEKVRRTIVAAGDEMTIICNARDGLDVVKAYFKDMKEGTSCAGVAIFHSHAPYSDAYRIAEECCERGKSLMKQAGCDAANLVDFHYCQGGIGISLEHILEREFGKESQSKPWKLDASESDINISPVFEPEELKNMKSANDKNSEEDKKCNLVNEMAKNLKKLGRSNVKTLRDAAKIGDAELEMELRRINAHRKSTEQIDFTLNGKLCDAKQKRKLIYDISIIYDLWFRKEKEDGKEDCKAEN